MSNTTEHGTNEAKWLNSTKSVEPVTMQFCDPQKFLLDVPLNWRLKRVQETWIILKLVHNGPKLKGAKTLHHMFSSVCLFRQVPIAKCNCGVPKHWSGAHCEMDKFDAMIGYLAAIVPTFCQAEPEQLPHGRHGPPENKKMPTKCWFLLNLKVLDT